MLHSVRNNSTGADQICQKPFIDVDGSFVLCPIPSVVGLRQHSPDFGPETKGVGQHLEDDVAFRRSKTVMPLRRQTEGVGRAVREIEPAVQGV